MAQKFKIMKRNTLSTTFLIFLCLSISATADTVRVLAISDGKALVNVNNNSQMTMTPGSEIEGVRLVNIKNNAANFYIMGDLHSISTGQMAIVSTSNFTKPHDPESNGIVIRKENSTKRFREVSIHENRTGSYLIDGTINGIAVRFQIDTGAATIAMSRDTGTRIGLPIGKGIQSINIGATGRALSRTGTCQKVTVGQIELANVLCSISEKQDNGMLNQVTLLGMSFLRRINMRQENGVLTLSQAY